MGKSFRVLVARRADELDAKCGFIAFDGGQSELHAPETSGGRSRMNTHEPMLAIGANYEYNLRQPNYWRGRFGSRQRRVIRPHNRRLFSSNPGLSIGFGAERSHVLAGRVLPGRGLDFRGSFTSSLLEGVASVFLEHSGDLANRDNVGLGGKTTRCLAKHGIDSLKAKS